MKILIKKRAKVWIEAGVVVDTAPADANFLIAGGSAEPAEAVVDPEKAAEKPARKRTGTKKEG